LGLTEQDSIDYIKFLSTKAASLGLSTGLKNGGKIISSVLPYVHFSVNEQCVEFAECDEFAAFIADAKPVFHIEYPKEVDTSVAKAFCTDTGAAEGSKDFSTVLKNLNLDGYVKLCDGSVATTPVTQ
jgi:hypothetical protein